MSVSQNGVLVYGREASQSSRVVWFGRDGKSTPVNAAPVGYSTPRLSPDESRLAVSITESETGTADIYQIDLMRGTPTRFTFEPSAHSFPLWSPDAKKIAFAASPEGGASLYMKPANGSGGEERILPPSGGIWQALYDWSRDGRYILFLRLGDTTGPDLWIFDLNERTSKPFLNTRFTESQGQFPPDGRWVAYSSDESVLYEIYVRSFTGNAQFQVSHGGGAPARWRGDGKDIYYATPGGKMMRSALTRHPEPFNPAPRASCLKRALCLA